MRRLLAPLGLAAALFAIGWLNLHWTENPPDLSPLGPEKTPGQADQGDTVPTGSPEPIQAGQISQTLLRPLFHASRRPFEMPPPKPAEPAFLPEPVVAQPVQPVVITRPELRLAGISLSGTRKRALIVAVQTSEARWYSPGESIEGWTIASVTSADVTLANGGQSITVGLYPSSPQDGGQQ